MKVEGVGKKNYPPSPHPYLRQAIAVYRTSTGAWYVYPRAAALLTVLAGEAIQAISP